MYWTPLIHMFHICNTVYGWHMYYMCKVTCIVQVYISHMYYMCKATCIMQVYIPHMYYMCKATCIMQVYISHMYYMCKVACIMQVYISHMYYMCKATCILQVYISHMYYMCKVTCIMQVYISHMYYMCRIYMCNTCLANTCVIYMFCTCNTHKTPYMYYRCFTIGHIDNYIYKNTSRKPMGNMRRGWVRKIYPMLLHVQGIILKLHWYILKLNLGTLLVYLSQTYCQEKYSFLMVIYVVLHKTLVWEFQIFISYGNICCIA